MKKVYENCKFYNIESLRNYFGQFGQVVDCVVMRDTVTHRSRGFGFLTMKDNAAIDKIMSQDHELDGKRVSPFL
jgi:RNA recognition motif-containing protein